MDIGTFNFIWSIFNILLYILIIFLIIYFIRSKKKK